MRQVNSFKPGMLVKTKGLTVFKPGDLVRFDQDLQAGPKGTIAMIVSTESPQKGELFGYVVYKVLVNTEIRRINSDYLRLVKVE